MQKYYNLVQSIEDIRDEYFNIEYENIESYDYICMRLYPIAKQISKS